MAGRSKGIRNSSLLQRIERLKKKNWLVVALVLTMKSAWTKRKDGSALS
ncbi:hypothetical protein M493_01170 [Geobacillus genomosp. 3]|uniref:Uncharacterized protein n=1 Tax=Geobacillus genomosp. 3 TaxID=1921421 RepID=S5Z0V8_GEOG3|nr:hypothetical protein M493_01170 [Geobacillus genomosp. 3]